MPPPHSRDSDTAVKSDNPQSTDTIGMVFRPRSYRPRQRMVMES